MRRLVLLPPHNQWAPWTDPPDPYEPDREATFRHLAARGYSYVRIDPHGLPWNPFAKAHPALCSIDPFRALRVLLFHRRADVVFCYYESAALLILLLRRLFMFRGKVMIYDVGVGFGWRLRNAILRFVLPRADMLLPLGRNQVAPMLTLGARPDAIRPVLDATSIDFYPQSEDQPNGYILAMGDDKSRDYQTLLKATVGLAREVVIRSRLPIDEQGQFPNITRMSQRLTLPGYQQLIAGAALVVLPLHPSTHAGGITALLEAMASGKAVIVSASPGLADHLRDGETCRVIPCGNPAALRAAIDDLLADTAMRRRLGDNARRFIVDNCSPLPEAKRFAAAFDELLGSAAPSLEHRAPRE